MLALDLITISFQIEMGVGFLCLLSYMLALDLITISFQIKNGGWIPMFVCPIC